MSLKKGTVRAKEIENINAQDVSDIKTTLALENVDNTSDANKPISTDTQNALNLKADDSSISSVGKSGNHSDLNLDDGTNPHNTNQSDVGLGNVDNTSDLNKPVSNASQNALDDKVDKVAGQGLSDENYTLAEKNKLAGIENNAEVNTVDSVNTQTGDVVLDADDIDDLTTTNKFTSQADIDRLANTSGTNTGDQDISGIGVNASDITDLQNNKVDKVAGQGLSDENYTLTEKNKLAGIEDGAEVNIPETITNLSITSNILTYVNENGTNQDIDLSLYLDDTNLARIISGEYVAGDNVLRFTRDDGSTFDIDASMFFDDTNLVTSVNTQTGDVVLDADDIDDSTTTNKFTSQSDIDRLANTSGTNTGDQDLSDYVDQANAKNLSLGENYANVKINDFVNDGFDVYPTDAGYQYAKLLQQDKLNDTSVLLLPQATKAGELGANKGSNFTASRATTATRVNENGLIESVAVNVPRIDYTNGNCPSILVEEQRTNLFTYSEEFSVNNIANPIVTVNTDISPDGNQTADTLTDSSTSSLEQVKYSLPLTQGASYVFAVFIKKDTDETRFPEIGLSMFSGGTTKQIFTQINTFTGNIINRLATSTESSKVIDYGDYWRLIIKITDSNDGNTIFQASLRPSASEVIGSFSANETGSIIVWGAQLEEGTEASSYIPTTSSAVTRNADVLSNNLTGVLQPTYTAFIEITANDSRLKVEDVDTGFDIPLNGTGKIVMVVDSQITFYFPDNGQPQTTLVYEKPDEFRDLEILSKLNSNSIKLLAIENGVATQTEINNFVSGDITSYFIETDWLSKSNLTDEFRGEDWDYFPVIDTSLVTSFTGAWLGNNLTSFPALDVSSGEDFRSAWLNNQLTSIPLLDLSSGTNFYNAFRLNQLTSIPLLDLSSGIDFESAFRDNLLTSFPANRFDTLTSPADNCFFNTWLTNSIDAQGVENILVSINTSGANAPASGTVIRIDTDGSALTTAATTAVANLKTKGWTITIDGVTL